MSVVGGGTVVVNGGVLRMTGTPLTNSMLTTTGYTGNLLIRELVGQVSGGGGSNVGLRVGGNRIVFHPNYGAVPGAFRVEGNGGFGNTSMGFVPPAGSLLNTLEVFVRGNTKKFLIAVPNYNNPDQVFYTTFTNPLYQPGIDTIGPTRNAGADDPGLFDNLVINQITSPGPPTLWTNAVLASAPLHWYRLNESGSIAIDYGSGALDGIYQNGVVRGQAGIPLEGDLAARFDGVNDQVYLGGSNLSGPWSAEFVLDKVAIEDAGSLLRGPGLALRLDQWQLTGRVGYTAFGVADYLVTPAVIAPMDKWTHLAYVADPTGGIQVYLDGVLAGSNPNYIPLPRDLLGGGDTANMLLDEVVLYDRLLAPQEIMIHASAVGLPEPGSMALLGLGLLALRRRQTKRSS
jgi:MYXO-CTERM domain-containing protein